MTNLVCIKDFESLSSQLLPLAANAYFNSGATDEQTLKDNCEAYNKWRFKPKILRDVSKVDTTVKIDDQIYKTPIFVAPTAICKWACSDGELAAAQAAYACGSIYILSAWATTSIEEIAEKTPNLTKWMQDQATTLDLIHRAEKCSYKAIVFTVDTPVRGTKYTCEKLGVKMPAHLKFENLPTIMNKRKQSTSYLPPILDEVITWDDVDWLRTKTKLPIILKGILTVESALESLNHKVDGIFVSNHGGRQLDGVTATIDALPSIARAVDKRCPIYFDGGIRCGADAVKAIALGATAVLVGRPVIWGLACEGEEGVQKVLNILQDEFCHTMKLLGVTSIKELQETPNLLVREIFFKSVL